MRHIGPMPRTVRARRVHGVAPGPHFCATCIDREGTVLSEIDGRSVWLCPSCDDGADHSLPDSINELERLRFASQVRTLVRFNESITIGEVCELLNIHAPNNSAEYQRVLRVVTEARRAA